MRRLRWFLVACWLSLACGSVPVDAHAETSPVLVLGRISDDPKAHYDQLKPLLDYVVPRMHDVGIRRGEILMAPDAQRMASYLRRGRVDWITETAGNAMLMQRRGGAHPLLLTERGGARDYHTVFFVRRDSPVQRLEQLRGRTLALQSPWSTSAYLVPLMTLLGAHLRPEILMSPHDVPAPDAVGYLLVRTETNIAAFVHKRLADAGAFSDQDWADAHAVPDAFRRDFRILHASAPVPRALEMVRAGMDPAVERRLGEVLRQAASDPQAAPALRKFFGTTGFHPIDAEARRRLRRLGDGMQRVRMDVE